MHRLVQTALRLKRSRLAVALAVLGVLLFAVPAAADSTETLPGGVFRLHVRPMVAAFNERWSGEGEREQLTNDLDDVELDNQVFTDLAQLERVYGMPDGSLSVGRSHIRSDAMIQAVVFAAEYGVTDRLTVGLIVPYVRAVNSLGPLSMDPGDIGHNPGDGKIKKDDSPYLPLDHDKVPSTKPLDPLGVEDVKRILVEDYGYEPLDDFKTHGLGDIELGAKYRIVELGPWHTSLQAGVRAPTGEINDPDNILAIGLGAGCWAAGFGWQNDFVPRDDVRLNLTLRYNLQLPDKQVRRVQMAADLPITSEENKEEVWRNLGDSFEVEAAAIWRPLPWLTPYLRYKYFDKQRDEVRGNRGLSYESLMDLTDAKNHLLEAGITFSTLSWLQAGKTQVPFEATLAYEQSIAGRNRAIVTHTVALDMATYFKAF